MVGNLVIQKAPSFCHRVYAIFCTLATTQIIGKETNTMEQGALFIYIVGIILAWIRISNGSGFPVDRMSPEMLGKINRKTAGGIATKILLSLLLGYVIFAFIIITGIIKLFQIIASM